MVGAGEAEFVPRSGSGTRTEERVTILEVC